MRLISFGRSSRADKKYQVVIESEGRKKTIHFGARGYSDFTTNKSDLLKKSYIARHSINENFRDPTTAGFWARWILWNKPTVAASLADVKSRFNLGS